MTRYKTDLFNFWIVNPECHCKMIFPDGAISSCHRDFAYIGANWNSTYWQAKVEVVEICDDTVWVEEVLDK